MDQVMTGLTAGSPLRCPDPTETMLEVRRGCDGRLLGYLPKMVSHPCWVICRLESPDLAPRFTNPMVLPLPEDLIKLEAVYFTDTWLGLWRILCFRSLHEPLEKLRRIPGWRDAGGVERV